jgi:uncharacterized protein (DUF952 family)
VYTCIMAIIYHVTSREEWNRASENGVYIAPSLALENFIHCSKPEQVEGVLSRYFKGMRDLVRLTIDTDKLTAPWQYDLARSINEEFPHVYGPINTDAVIEIASISSPV